MLVARFDCHVILLFSAECFRPSRHMLSLYIASFNVVETFRESFYTLFFHQMISNLGIFLTFYKCLMVVLLFLFLFNCIWCFSEISFVLTFLLKIVYCIHHENFLDNLLSIPCFSFHRFCYD